MTVLQLDEANELLAAWAWRRAEARGIRLLLLKGRPLSDDGLRAPRTSADIDVLVEPTRFDEYCDAVVADGWEEFPGTFASDHFTLHSRSFRRDGWPNSFDVHSEYPGFLRDRAVVFDALWAGRRTADFAHHDCPVPSRAANLLIIALHSLRGTYRQERHKVELEGLQRARFTDAEKSAIADLAAATGSSASLRDLLPELGIEVRIDDELLASDAYREWRRKVAEAQGAGASWILLLRRARWRDKPEVVLRALWPTRHDFAISHPELPDRFWPMFFGRIARWGRGFSRLPAALTALRRP